MARRMWRGEIGAALQQSLETLSSMGVCVADGDIQLLNGHWYITHAGLLRIARRHHCYGIHVQPIPEFSDSGTSTWTFSATVYTTRSCKGFAGFGDADPSNVSPQVRGAEMRVAETRAVNRALRKAYGIGICSVEELGASATPPDPSAHSQRRIKSQPALDGGHPVRDRLCLLIRQHKLDAALVKAYAADFCEVAELRQATREQIANFIEHLAEYAQHDRAGLICQLEGYSRKPVSSSTSADDSPATEIEGDRGSAGAA